MEQLLTTRHKNELTCQIHRISSLGLRLDLEFTPMGVNYTCILEQSNRQKSYTVANIQKENY